MPKVIQNNKFNSILRRGSEDTRTLIHKNHLLAKTKGVLSKVTLASLSLHPRRSGTYIQQHRNFKNLGLAAGSLLVLLTLLSITPIVINGSSADAADGTASTITITTDGTGHSGTASVDLKVTNPTSGTFVESSDSELAKIGVRTTNYTGYTLSLSSSDNNGRLINSSTGTYFTSVSTATDKDTFDTTAYNGKWGYKYGKVGASSYAVDNNYFWPSPTTTATILDKTDGANSTDNEYTLGLGVRANATLAAGTYSHTFNLTATANPVTYAISYKDNTGDSTVKNLPDGTLDGSTNSTTSRSIPISSVTPSRTGYQFVGWCTVATTNSGKTCSGTTYKIGDTYPINQTSTNNITLYAVWSVPTYDVVIKPGAGISQVTMVNASGSTQTCTNASGCTISGLTYGQSYAITATASTGYTFGAWSNVGAGEVANITSSSTSYKVGEGSSTIIATTTGGTYSLKLNFSGGGVSSVQVRTAKGTGGTLVGTVNTSGGSVSGLVAGQAYYLYPTFTSGNMLSGWSMSGDGYLSCELNTQNVCAGETNPVYVAEKNGATITIASTSANMQGFTRAQCNAMPIGATVTLKDTRDGESYLIGKLANGSCWMMDNLRLDLTNSTVKTNLTQDTTNAATYALNCLKNGGCEDMYAESAVSTTWTNSYTKPEIAVSGNKNGGGTWNKNTTVTSYGAGSGKVGVYYNYCAATAGSYCNSPSYTPDDGDYEPYYDICPAGWRLPTGGANGDYKTLYLAYNSNQSDFKTALSTPLSGDFGSSVAYSQGSDGYFWSSTYYGSSVMYGLGVYSSNVSPAGDDGRSGGSSVRCVVK